MPHSHLDKTADMVIVVMGAAGAGKTTLGRELARVLGWTFIEADDLHDSVAIDRMKRGIPLTDQDRWPWLARVRDAIASAHHAGHDVVAACSALKDEYRRVLGEGVGPIAFVYLDASAALLHERLAHRPGHFMPESLVESQLATLEPPADAVRVDAALPTAAQIAAVRTTLGL
jgi:gluconokinase